MAFADDLRNFLEGRLLAYDPAIDLSDNSPAQSEIITPVLQRFEEDPFSTDIPTFMRDRLTQEFPELAADGGAELEDLLVKPLQLLLEPFKREIELVKLAQSTRNASLLSEEEADALGANWFSEREEGDYSGGTVRLYFSQPATVRVSTDRRCYTSDGRSYFPVQSYFITSQAMLFNRQGSFYFLDIRVQAETQGDAYNVEAGDIVGIEEVPGVVRVSNPTAFVSGIPRETNEQFLEATEQSLTTRSLGVTRGVLTQVRTLFDSVRAVQVVGAGEEGMNRDILTGTGEGFLHLVGSGVIFGGWIFASQVYYRDDGPDNTILPQAGDTIRFHLGTVAPASTAMFETTIESFEAVGNLYLFVLSSSPVNPDTAQDITWSLLKPGYITISNAPGGISSEITVPSDVVHLGGHTDVFLRPSEDAEVRTTLQSVTDDSPLVAITDLEIPTANQNLVRSSSSDFVTSDVRAGDTIVIETGTGFAGTYRILEIDSATDLRVDAAFVSTTTGLRARVVRNIRVDLVEPKIPKLPFTPGPVSDLITTVGSNKFRFATINIQEFGASLGDTINILQGPDAGTYTIIGFDIVFGSVIVDRIATATNSNLSYEIYTPQTGIARPLVRVKTIEALDSTGQGTGITVPYGDAVDIRPTSNFEGAGNAVRTYDPVAIIFPDLSDEWGAGGLTADPIPLVSIDQTTDASYSLNLKQAADGSIIRTITHDSANQVESTEVEVPAWAFNGKRDVLLALVSRADNEFPATPGVVHRTSDLAEAKIGDSLIIHDGPNQGRYIISNHVVLDLWGKAEEGHRKVALVQVDPPLKVDPIRTAINLIDHDNGSPLWTAAQLFGFLQYAADWDNAGGFYNTFITALNAALTSLGLSFGTDDELKAFFDPLCRVSYSVGPSARGTFRCYFLDPVSVEFYFGESPTTFTLASDGTKSFRLDPDMPDAQVLPESLVGTSPFLWDRNLGIEEVQGVYAFLTSGSSFGKRGIRTGDVLEYHLPVLDLPARKSMTSSWMCITQAGSNIVQLIIPQSNGTDERFYGGADNYADLEAGQLFFIDSGPDIGTYTIVKVVEQNWVSNPPVLRVQLDQTLTHTTEGFPVLSTPDTQTPQADFESDLCAYVLGGEITFPINLNGTHLEVDYSTDGGATWNTVEHQFTGANPFNNIAAVVADIDADAPFVAVVDPTAFGNRLALSTVAVGPRTRVRISTSPTAPTAHAILELVNGTVGRGVRGAATLPGTKRLYGSDLDQVEAGDYITIYAAYSETLIGDGNDANIIGTYEVASVGTDSASAPFWGGTGTFVELSRTDNFPAGDEHIEVRWLRHVAPDTEPADTSGGGKEISDQFVRVRLYEPVSHELSIVSLPWAESPHPLLDTSERQIELESAIIDTGLGQRNWAHLAPFRVMRPGVFRISSTEMASQRDGALYYVDLPVIGYGPGEEMNVTPEEGFVLDGDRKVFGYTLEVDDENLAFSMQEEVHLVLPNSVLPVGSTADLDNEFSLAGQNLEITYNNAPVVEDIQAFLGSPLDRTTNANMLARHFLPAYVLVDAVYSGGSSEDVVASDVVSYINNIDPDVNEIRADLVENTIKRRGANTVDLPITLIALFHGTDRRIRGMRSETSIGIGDTPFFRGTFKQTYFISGPNTSKEIPRPSGEQVFLRRT